MKGSEKGFWAEGQGQDQVELPPYTCPLGSEVWQTAPLPSPEALVFQGFQQKGLPGSLTHQGILEKEA